MNETTKPCGECPLTATATTTDPEAALAVLERCGSCPHSEAMAPALRLLRTATRALQVARADLRRSQLECRELGEGMRDDGERITKLEAMQVTSGRELEAAVRERDTLLRQLSGELRRVSTPILEVGEGVLALPIVGSFDERRANEARDDLLNAVGRTGASQVVIDLTGVADLDGETARRLIDLCRALRLLGAAVCLSGISAQVAQSLAAGDVDLTGLRTMRTLKEALRGGPRRQSTGLAG